MIDGAALERFDPGYPACRRCGLRRGSLELDGECRRCAEPEAAAAAELARQAEAPARLRDHARAVVAMLEGVAAAAAAGSTAERVALARIGYWRGVLGDLEGRA